MTSRRALAKAYVELLGKHSATEAAAALATRLRREGLKVDVELLTRDIGRELLSRKGHLTGTISSARPLSADQLEALSAKLRAESGATTSALESQVDPHLLGGVVATTPIGTFNASVRRILDDMETL